MGQQAEIREQEGQVGLPDWSFPFAIQHRPRSCPIVVDTDALRIRVFTQQEYEYEQGSEEGGCRHSPTYITDAE